VFTAQPAHNEHAYAELSVSCLRGVLIGVTRRSEEGIDATMRDARARHVREPDLARSYIPVRVQTMCAPAAYALHAVLAPPAFDWVTSLEGEAVRASCTDSAVQLLSAPKVLEEITFHEPLVQPLCYDPTVRSGEGPNTEAEGGREDVGGVERRSRRELEFELCAERMATATASYLATLRREGLSSTSGAHLAASMAHALSGLACWPRLQLDEAGAIVLDARGRDGGMIKGCDRRGEQQHWSTVLPLLAPRPLNVAAGDGVRIAFEVERGRRVDEPTRYELRGEVLRRAEHTPVPAVVLRRHSSLEAACCSEDATAGGERVDEDSQAEPDGMVYAFVE
jgi:hypothetical protein